MCLHLLTYPSGGNGNITVLKFFPIQHVILKGIPLHDRCEVKGVQLQQSVQQVYAACWIQTMQYQPSNIMRCLIMSKQYVSQCVLVLMEFTVAVFICFFFFYVCFSSPFLHFSCKVDTFLLQVAFFIFFWRRVLHAPFLITNWRFVKGCSIISQ